MAKAATRKTISGGNGSGKTSPPQVSSKVKSPYQRTWRGFESVKPSKDTESKKPALTKSTKTPMRRKKGNGGR